MKRTNTRQMVTHHFSRFDCALRCLTRALFTLCCMSLAVSAAARTLTIADITTTDALGYSCIEAHYLDETDDNGFTAVAFTLSGKMRLPRTCLPEPCARALTRAELAALTGTPRQTRRSDREWDDYYARYADHCRRETVPADGPDPTLSTEGFWSPLVDTPRLTALDRATPGLQLVSGGGARPGTGGVTPPLTTAGNGTSGGHKPKEPLAPDPNAHSVPQIPLPLPIVLLGGACLALLVGTRGQVRHTKVYRVPLPRKLRYGTGKVFHAKGTS